MLKIEYIPISEINPYEKNPRKNDKAVDIVAKSIKEYGFNVPILLDKNNTIIAGHTRLKAAIKLDMTEVPIIWIENLTEEQVKAFRIMDNKSIEYSFWDFDLVKTELFDLKNSGFDLSFTGFTELDINKILPINSEDDFELPKEAKYKVELGDIYQLDEHRLMCGDSSKDYDKLINGSIDLLFTDPPYGIDTVKDNHKIGFGDGRLESKSSNGSVTIGGRGIVQVGVHRKIINDDKSFDPVPLLNFGKNQIIWGGNYFASKLRDSSCWIIWDKREEIPSNNFADCEIAWSSFNKAARIYRQLWSGLLRKGERNEEMNKRQHPTQKPVGIHKSILNDFSKEGEVILDLYGGSGTTLIACEQTNRICYMMEIDPFYCSIIIQRWENLTGKKAIKLPTNPTNEA